MKQILKKTLIGLGLIVMFGAGGVYIASRASLLPTSLNMGSTIMTHSDMSMPNESTHLMSEEEIPVTRLVAPASDAPIKRFTLTAQKSQVDLGQGHMVEAWTYNGTAPGPELRVEQGDRVIVELINRDIEEGVTIHWHGIDVPNAMDGVAGVTQDAVRPGESFTYEFIANEVGTYWYHSHQSSSIQVTKGLYGVFVVLPKDAIVHYDHDYTVDLREWGSDEDCFQNCGRVLTMNGVVQAQTLMAAPGELVRLRLVNSGQDLHIPTLVGAPSTVIALDGHDLNEPTPLDAIRFPVAQAQRYDLSFKMPEKGSVYLIDRTKETESSVPMFLTIGQPTEEKPVYPMAASLFDFTTYGSPDPEVTGQYSVSDIDYQMELGSSLGFYDGQFTMRFTINGEVNPYVPMLVVQPNQIVRIHINNLTDDQHPMHLHGHHFVVLTKNGQPLSGSPILLDTLSVGPGESYDIAFRADNPGLWMDHCHILRHAARGMSVMVVYPHISTPFNVGSATGNLPE